MIESIPKGELIGTMQAPLAWIFSHTARFLGVARITIQDGDGIILIEKARPRFFYYRQGGRVLKGHAAEDYFSSQPVIHFSLFKLTAEEFTLALSIADPDTVPKQTHDEPPPVTHQDKPSPTIVQRQLPEEKKPHVTETPPEGTSSLIKDEKEGGATVGSRDLPLSREDLAPKTTKGKTGGDVVTTGQVHTPSELPVSSGTQDPIASDKEKTLAAGTTLPQHDNSDFQTMSRPALVQQAAEEHIPDVDMRTIAQILLGWIKTIPGVVAVMVFNKDMNIISIGDINLNTLVSSAEDMLMTVNQLDSIMEWGSFVQMTIQVPSGNVIIAPFFNEYLCILTTPEINLGRIRRILKEIKLQQNR